MEQTKTETTTQPERLVLAQVIKRMVIPDRVEFERALRTGVVTRNSLAGKLNWLGVSLRVESKAVGQLVAHETGIFLHYDIPVFEFASPPIGPFDSLSQAKDSLWWNAVAQLMAVGETERIEEESHPPPDSPYGH